MIAALTAACLLQHPITLTAPTERLEGHTAALRTVQFSPDGKRIFSASDAELLIWEGGQPVRKMELMGPCAFAGDGSRIAIADIETLRIIRTGTYESAKSLQVTTELGFSASDILIHAAFSNDGKQLALAGYEDLAVAYATETGAKKYFRLKRGPAEALAVSPDGSIVAVAHGDGSISLFSTKTDAEPETLSGFNKTVSCLAFSADGKYIGAGGEDGTARIWTLADRKLAKTISVKNVVFCIALSPDAKHIALSYNLAAQKSALEIYPLEGAAAEAKTQVGAWIFAVAFSPATAKLAAGCEDGNILIYSLAGTKTGH
jgi:WD40 repeat protein